MNINFNDVKEGGSERKDYASCGIHTFIISGLVEQEPENGSPYIEIGLVNDECQHSERMYTTPAAQEYTTEKLQKICLAVGIPKEEISKITSVIQLDKKLAGREADFKLSGKEVETPKGRFLRPQFGLGKFVAPKGSGQLKFIDNKRGEKGDIQWFPEENDKSESKKSIFN